MRSPSRRSGSRTRWETTTAIPSTTQTPTEDDLAGADGETLRRFVGSLWLKGIERRFPIGSSISACISGPRL